MMPETKTIPLGQRRKLLRRFREQYGITLDEFGPLAELSTPMLSQFENGGRDLSPEAWTRVLAAMSNLITEDNTRRFAEIEKAKQTAEKLGAPMFFGVRPGELIEHLFKSDEQIAKETAKIEAEKIRLQEVSNLSESLIAELDQQAQELLGTTGTGEALQQKITEHIANEIAPKLFEQCRALTEWRQKILDLEAQGYALFLKSDVEAKDRRIAELEEQLRKRDSQ
jgi:transcriptional regulator with XRE-family HTH domain